MKQLLLIEWLKIRSYRTFYIFIGFYILLIASVYYGFDSFIQLGPVNLSVVYQFPNVWYYTAFVSTWFAAIPGLLMINLVSNEISFRTLRQQITEGMSRKDFLVGKLLLAVAISLLTGLVVFLSGMAFGFIKGGLPTSSNFFSDMSYILRAVWVSFGMMSAAILLALLVKRSALAILVYLAIYWIIEPLAGRAFMPDLYAYFPMNSLDEFIVSPFQAESIQFGKQLSTLSATIAGIIYPLLFIAGAYSILKKRDL
jgi:ABC-type transport system involved in multi-copper enzyme maturation permease subunit